MLPMLGYIFLGSFLGLLYIVGIGNFCLFSYWGYVLYSFERLVMDIKEDQVWNYKDGSDYVVTDFEVVKRTFTYVCEISNV